MFAPLVLSAVTLLGPLVLFGVMFDSGGGNLMAASSASLSILVARRRGRPRKFAAPSRAVTLTLPESVLQKLSSIHHDVSRAIVQIAQGRAPAKEKPLAELSVFGRHAVITVRPTASLETHAGITLVPLPDGRALISFDQPRTIPELELTLRDELDNPRLPVADREVFEAILRILKDARRSSGVTLHRRNIIVLEWDRRKRKRAVAN
jgi:hypothetical protein